MMYQNVTSHVGKRTCTEIYIICTEVKSCSEIVHPFVPKLSHTKSHVTHLCLLVRQYPTLARDGAIPEVSVIYIQKNIETLGLGLELG